MPYLPLLNKADYLPSNLKNKIEQVWGLVSDGKFTTGQITSVVHTTKDYVWKETSKPKSKTVGSAISYSFYPLIKPSTKPAVRLPVSGIPMLDIVDAIFS